MTRDIMSPTISIKATDPLEIFGNSYESTLKPLI
jgi:hypothetical protein